MINFLILVNTRKNMSRLNDINLLFSQEEKENYFNTHIALVSDIKEFKKEFEKQIPDILLLDIEFETDMKIVFLEEFQKINENNCKLIMTYTDKKERKQIEKLPIANRFFPYKVSNNTIHKALLEIYHDELLPNTLYDDEIYNLVKLLKLDLKSPSTRHFVLALQILLNKSSQYLFWGYFYNVIYTISRIENVSTETIRKNLSKIKNDLTSTDNKDLIEAIFKSNKVSELNSSDVLEYCIEYIKNIQKESRKN